MSSKTKTIALGGMLAAAAVVIMCMGGLIPFATYICPMLCIMVQDIVLRLCKKRIAWTWYGVVAILSLLLGPDKEAAGVFLLMGYYPMVKPILEKWRISWLWKLMLFNTAVTVLYACLLHLMGLENTANEFAGFGIAGLIILLILGNVTFLLMDKFLTMASKKWSKRGS